MKRYFYTDPLAAAWMAKHHGMRFANYNNGIEITLDDILNHALTGNICGIHIHADSLYLVEPRGGDVVINKAGWSKPISKIEDDVAYWTEHGHYHGCSVHDCKVIRRRGIAFMWPESEAA